MTQEEVDEEGKLNLKITLFSICFFGLIIFLANIIPPEMGAPCPVIWYAHQTIAPDINLGTPDMEVARDLAGGKVIYQKIIDCN